MPQPLTKEELDSNTDPTIAHDYDNETPKDKQIEEFYATVDKLKIGLLSTLRPNIGPVARSMAVAKRTGPDFLFIANNHSQKFKDLENDKLCQITFQDSSNQDWASITGKATTTSNSDPRIKELYNPGLSAWFGDVGDGVHNGTWSDPRMTLIEVSAKHIVYWKSTVTKLGFVKEIAMGALKGEVASTGITRELGESDIERMRKEA